MKKSILSIVACLLFSGTVFSQKRQAHVPGEVIVQLAPGTSMQQLVANLQRIDGQPVQLTLQRELSPPLRIYLLGFDFQKISEDRVLSALRQMPEVSVAQLNHRIELRETVPDDPNFSGQWQWLNEGQSGGTPDADVDADLAWDLTTGGATTNGQEIVVCVVEGCNRNHPDLQGNLWVNAAEVPDNGLDDDGNGYVDDYEGWNVSTETDFINPEMHGTSVSGVIGAKGNNGLLLAGLNWDVKIMHVDFSNAVEADVIAAYTYPLVQRRLFNESGGTQGALVVATNSSWGINEGNPENFPLWCAIYDSLGAAGILNTVSTSNFNVDVDEVGDMPSTCPSEFLIAVTATNHHDERASTGYGPVHVDVGAPGKDLLLLNQNGGPSLGSGTSFASPVVAGMVGLLYSAPCPSLGLRAIADPAGTAKLVRNAILEGVEVKPNLVSEVKTGGRVNVFNSLELLLENCGRCEQPFGLLAMQIDDSSASLGWTSTDSTVSTNLRWRMVGAPSWTVVGNAVSPFSLTNLLSCTDYEFQLEDMCADTTSGYTTSFVFKTDGCCEAPESVTISGISESGVTISWSSVFAAQGYNLHLTGPSGTTTFPNLPATTLVLNALEPCTTYEVQVEVVCAGGESDLGPVLEFLTHGCGTCLDADYCEAESSNAEEEWIAGVSLNGIGNLSGSNDGYGDFTDVTTDLLTWQSYPILLTPGFTSFEYAEWFSAWIDLNHDGDFDDANEEVFDPGSASLEAVGGTILIPGNALPGPTRMRVIMRFNVEPEPCDNNFNFGEVEDYCVNIVEGPEPDCHPPLGLFVSDLGPTFASLGWGATPDAQSYELRIRPTSSINWTVISANVTAVNTINLGFCTHHEFQVRSVCLDSKSVWSQSAFFQTGCTSATAEQQAGLRAVGISPNPFSEKLRVEIFLEQPSEVEIKLFNATGQLVLIEKMNAQATEQVAHLDSAVLPPGIYFLKIQTESGAVLRKVVCER